MIITIEQYILSTNVAEEEVEVIVVGCIQWRLWFYVPVIQTFQGLAIYQWILWSKGSVTIQIWIYLCTNLLLLFLDGPKVKSCILEINLLILFLCCISQHNHRSLSAIILFYHIRGTWSKAGIQEETKVGYKCVSTLDRSVIGSLNMRFPIVQICIKDCL